MPAGDGLDPPDSSMLSDIGHGILDVAGLIPLIGEPADAANAAWYAAEGQYLEAGLSLISCIPVVGDVIGKGGKVAKRLSGPAVAKLAKLLKEMDVAKTLAQFRKNPKLAKHIDKIIAAVEEWQTRLLPCGKIAKVELKRPYIRKGVRDEIERRAPRTRDGRPIDPNTGKPIEGKPDLGHKPGHEFWREKLKAEKEGLTQDQFNDRMNNPDLYQLEDPSSNRSHKYERPR